MKKCKRNENNSIKLSLCLRKYLSYQVLKFHKIIHSQTFLSIPNFKQFLAIQSPAVRNPFCCLFRLWK